jgi:hypothetical protein
MDSESQQPETLWNQKTKTKLAHQQRELIQPSLLQQKSSLNLLHLLSNVLNKNSHIHVFTFEDAPTSFLPNIPKSVACEETVIAGDVVEICTEHDCLNESWSSMKPNYS